jgi:hypothetical protein
MGAANAHGVADFERQPHPRRTAATPKISLSSRLALSSMTACAMLLKGKERDGKRDFATSDLATYQELFIPPAHRDEIFRFVQGTVCPKEDIGRKVTAGGLIAISNWHVLSEEGEDETEEEITAPGERADPKPWCRASCR